MSDLTTPVIPDERLLDLIYRHQGVVTEAQLQEDGYTPARIRQLCQEQVLTSIGAKQYRLFDEFTYLDGLVLVQWAIPEGVLAGLTALSYWNLTVVLPGSVDVSVPPRWVGTIPPSVEPVNLIRLAPELFDYGVMTVYPDIPGTVPVRMYAPEVAVAQVLADPTGDREAQEECVPMYMHSSHNHRALDEALDRYGVHEIPEPYYAHRAHRR